MQRRGLVLLGAFQTAMRETESVVLWNVPTFGHFTEYLRDVETSRAERTWRASVRRWRVDHRETLLVASRWCVQHPEWSDALPRSQRA
jgi:hypothetical protein